MKYAAFSPRGVSHHATWKAARDRLAADAAELARVRTDPAERDQYERTSGVIKGWVQHSNEFPQVSVVDRWDDWHTFRIGHQEEFEWAS